VITLREGGERHVPLPRINVGAGVTVGGRTVRRSATRGFMSDTERNERPMPRLELGAVRATIRSAFRHLDTWTLETLNSPAGGRRPRL